MAVTVTFHAQTYDTTALTTYSFASQAIGTAAADRYVVVGVHGIDNASAFNVASMTIGGVAAAAITGAAVARGNEEVEFWYALVTSGTTATISITFSEQMAVGCDIAVWSVTGWTGAAAPTDTLVVTTGTDFTGTIDCDAGGAIIAMTVFQVALTEDKTAAWTGLTEDFDFHVADVNSQNSSGAHENFASAQVGLTVTCDWSGTGTTAGVAFSLPPTAAAARRRGRQIYFQFN
jgi:hypothetical protein